MAFLNSIIDCISSYLYILYNQVTIWNSYVNGGAVNSIVVTLYGDPVPLNKCMYIHVYVYVCMYVCMYGYLSSDGSF